MANATTVRNPPSAGGAPVVLDGPLSTGRRLGCGSEKEWRPPFMIDAGLKREIEDKVYAGERLSRADGETLYACDDLAWLGRLAHHKRTELHGDRVMFNVNRHLNLTNVCSASCAY